MRKAYLVSALCTLLIILGMPFSYAYADSGFGTLTDDTHIRSGSGSTNYNGNRLYLGNDGDNRQILLKYDTSALGSGTINGLVLTLKDISHEGGNINTYCLDTTVALSSDFDETTATWNSYSSGYTTTVDTGTTCGVANGTDTVFTFDDVSPFTLGDPIIVNLRATGGTGENNFEEGSATLAIDYTPSGGSGTTTTSTASSIDTTPFSVFFGIILFAGAMIFIIKI